MPNMIKRQRLAAVQSAAAVPSILRQFLECGSPLPLSIKRTRPNSEWTFGFQT